MFLVLNGQFHSKNPQDINFFVHGASTLSKIAIGSFPHDFQKEVSKNFFKFLVVRHPIDRIWSAFLDTVYLQNWLDVVKYESVDATTTEQEKSKQCKHDTTFFDLLLNTIKRVNFNDHIASYIDLCDPCNVKYDAVVRLETLLSDISYIFKENRAMGDIDLSGYSNNSSSKKDTAKRIINDVFTSNQLKRKYTVDGNVFLCANSSYYANRLWMSFIWRKYVPSNAAYPQILRTGEDVSMELMLELYHNATSGATYEAASFRPKSKDEMIEEAFGKLTVNEKLEWIAVYGNDFKMFNYSVPTYLEKSRLMEN